jgi:hypothetical protein
LEIAKFGLESLGKWGFLFHESMGTLNEMKLDPGVHSQTMSVHDGDGCILYEKKPQQM